MIDTDKHKALVKRLNDFVPYNRSAHGDGALMREASASITALLEEVERGAKLREAVQRYHDALDNREHGGIAASRLVDDVQIILEMLWTPRARAITEKETSRG